MDHWAAKKRLLEQEDGPSDHYTEHYHLDTAGGATRLPMPGSAYSRDGPTLTQLPPLQVRTGSTSAESIALNPLLLPPPSPLKDSFPDRLNKHKQSPQSSSQFLQEQPKRQRLDSGTGLPIVSSLGKHALTNDTEVHRPHLRTHAVPPHEDCCPSDCKGQTCEPKPRSIASSLQWALELIKQTNVDIDPVIKRSEFPSPDGNPPRHPSRPSMKRGPPQPERDEEESYSTRRAQRISPGYSHSHSHSSSLSDHDRTRNAFSTDMPSLTGSARYTASSSGSTYMLPRPPLQQRPPSRATMSYFPSPASRQLPPVAALPPISPALTASPGSQAAHVQELQNQLSSKDHAFQELQREYDDLTVQLAHKTAKCTTLEHKIDATDVEIGELADEKEKLQAQVTALENQVEELRKDRDEERGKVSANSEQYTRIISMTTQLNAKAVEDKKRWETEKGELEQRIRILEEAMVTGSMVGPAKSSAGAEMRTATSSPAPYSRPENFNPHLAPFAVSAASVEESTTINVLRAEISRLRKRTQSLGEALQTANQKWERVKGFARQLLEHEDKMAEDPPGAQGED